MVEQTEETLSIFAVRQKKRPGNITFLPSRLQSTWFSGLLPQHLDGQIWPYCLRLSCAPFKVAIEMKPSAQSLAARV